MTKPSNTQSQKRFNESTGRLFGENTPKKCVFIKSSADKGVIRNGGRNGARFAPQSFLSTFKKFSQDEFIRHYSFEEHEISNPEEENRNFHEAQLLESDRMKNVLKGSADKRIIHLGGGHDHIYPLLRAFSDQYQKIIVINIDAHADTRTDEIFHSGTPFRQFASEFQGDFSLFQIGLHSFANSSSTLSPLQRGTSDILWKNNFTQENLTSFFKKIHSLIDEKTLTIFSLDADAMDGSIVPGVSAVNPRGFTYQELLEIWLKYSSLPLSHEPVMGIYELNPVYDTLAGISMRNMASFVFETFRKE